MRKIVAIFVSLIATAGVYPQTTADLSEGTGFSEFEEWYLQPMIEIRYDSLGFHVYSSEPFYEIRILDSRGKLLWLGDRKSGHTAKFPSLLLKEDAQIVEGKGQNGTWRYTLKPT